MATLAKNESSDTPYIPESVSSHDIAISTFSQVIFLDIPDFYPPETDVAVSYSLTDSIEPSSRDWIGLFRVGWASPRDYSSYVWAPKCQNTSKTRCQMVSFPAYQLPGDDQEFYQFCYVTKQGFVRGASIPFQFRLCSNLVEMEDESGMIILQSKSDVLEDKLSALLKEKESLESTVDDMKKEKQLILNKVTALESELADLKETSETTSQKNQVMEVHLKELEEKIEKLKDQLDKTVSQCLQAQEALKAAEKTVENLTRQIEEAEELKQQIIDEKTADDEKHLKEIFEKQAKILEYEHNKITLQDQIKTLTLVKDESQKQCEASQLARENASKASDKMKEELTKKLQCCKDERDLFKSQLTESELSRQEALHKLDLLNEKLDEVENKISVSEQDLKVKQEELDDVNDKLQNLEKKLKRETTKHEDLLRTALERANGEKAAKQLLSKELSQTSAARDQLMADLTEAKKDKENLVEDLNGVKAVVTSLQAQLETVEKKLARSEELLLDHEKVVMEERKKAEDMEREMHNQVLILRNQLQQSDSALVAATASISLVSKKSENTQTTSQISMEDLPEDAKHIVEDLKAQVTDLKTRLNMGAEAYKNKFVECHKLDKKLKKMKQLLKTKEELATTPTTEEAPPTADTSRKGWMDVFDKFVATITDPDAEVREQAKSFQIKLESLQKSLEVEQGKHRKYKQLFNEEKGKLKDVETASQTRENDLQQSLNDLQQTNKSLVHDNQMLKEQLDEFIQQSGDVRMRKMIKCRRVSNHSLDDDEEPRDDDVKFQDAVDIPFSVSTSSQRTKSTSSEVISSASDISDDASGSSHAYANFNICADRDNEHGGAYQRAVPQKKKVISCQPIRSPPQTELFEFSSTSESSSSYSGIKGKQANKSARMRNKKGKKQKA